MDARSTDFLIEKDVKALDESKMPSFCVSQDLELR